jgi:hypothetical protein
MFKQIQLAVLLSCTSVSSYAYLVETNFTIENKTDVPLVVVVTQPDGLKPLQLILAHETRQILVKNGDSSGLLYQTSTAPFNINALDHKKNPLIVQGRIAFYVGASLGNKYSFLNALSAADGVTIDPSYSCKNGGYNTIFQNKIVIDGIPGNDLAVKAFPAAVRCDGLKSNDFNPKNLEYTPTCFDGNSSTFWPVWDSPGNFIEFFYTNGKWNDDHHYLVDYSSDSEKIHTEQNNKIGNAYCGTW